MKTDLDLLLEYMKQNKITQEALAVKIKYTRQSILNTINKAKQEGGVIRDAFKVRLMMFGIDVGFEAPSAQIEEPTPKYGLGFSNNDRLNKLEATNQILVYQLAKLKAELTGVDLEQCLSDIKSTINEETKDIA